MTSEMLISVFMVWLGSLISSSLATSSPWWRAMLCWRHIRCRRRSETRMT